MSEKEIKPHLLHQQEALVKIATILNEILYQNKLILEILKRDKIPSEE